MKILTKLKITLIVMLLTMFFYAEALGVSKLICLALLFAEFCLATYYFDRMYQNAGK